MGEHDEGAAESVGGAEIGSFADVEFVIKGDGVLFGKFEGEGEDAAVAVGLARMAVVDFVVG